MSNSVLQDLLVEGGLYPSVDDCLWEPEGYNKFTQSYRVANKKPPWYNRNPFMQSDICILIQLEVNP